MTKKELQEQINLLDQENHEMEKEIIRLQKYRNLSEERYKMLLDYFKLEEKEYAELETHTVYGVLCSDSLLEDFRGETETKPIKKTKLVKKKK